MSNVETWYTITVAAVPFKVEIVTDEDMNPPWENSDGHGPVRRVERTGAGYGPPRKGEVRMNEPERGCDLFYYDWQAALAKALKDGWGGINPVPEGLTRFQRAQRAVGEDFAYLCGWLRDDWHYVGVTVTHAASDSCASLWGIESESAHLGALAWQQSIAKELIGDIQVLPGFIGWCDRVAAREQAPIVAKRLRRIADDTLYPVSLRKAAALLETLAKGDK